MMKNLLLAVLMVAGLFSGWPRAVAGAGNTFIDAAGATFPRPLYRQWFKAYKEQTGVRLSFTDTGSGEGIRRLLKHTVDIGASDIFLSDAEMAALPAEVIHRPTCLGAVAIIYNLPDSPHFRLTPDVIARLFLGDLTGWSETAIAAVNPNQRLPSLPVHVVHGSESSGTTFIFSNYLSKTSDRWRQQAGCAKRIPWPVGIGTEGNPGVAELVSRIPGSIGYVSLTYAAARNLPVAAVLNRSGRFLKPSPETVTAAAEGPVPSDTRVLFTDTPAADGYPISAFTYPLLYREQAYAGKDRKKAQGIVDFLGWVLTEGQRHAAPLFYAPLPSSVVDLALARLRTVTYQGAALWPNCGALLVGQRCPSSHWSSSCSGWRRVVSGVQRRVRPRATCGSGWWNSNRFATVIRSSTPHFCAPPSTPSPSASSAVAARLSTGWLRRGAPPHGDRRTGSARPDNPG